MDTLPKNILIVDEHRFSRVCSAILEMGGYGTEMISQTSELPAKLNKDSVGLVVTSYPYGEPFLDEIKKSDIPTIILSDNIDGNLMSILDNYRNSYCLVKPLDYDKFRQLVRKVICGDEVPERGYENA